MDVIPEEQSTPRWVALYELGLLLRTASGRVHSLAAYLGWLYDAGFEPPERHRLVGQVQTVLLVARALTCPTDRLLARARTAICCQAESAMWPIVVGLGTAA